MLESSTSTRSALPSVVISALTASKIPPGVMYLGSFNSESAVTRQGILAFNI